MSKFIQLHRPEKGTIGKWFVPSDWSMWWLATSGDLQRHDGSKPVPEFYFATEWDAHKAIFDYYTLHVEINPFTTEFHQMLVASMEEPVGSRELEL